MNFIKDVIQNNVIEQYYVKQSTNKVKQTRMFQISSDLIDSVYNSFKHVPQDDQSEIDQKFEDLSQDDQSTNMNSQFSQNDKKYFNKILDGGRKIKKLTKKTQQKTIEEYEYLKKQIQEKTIFFYTLFLNALKQIKLQMKEKSKMTLQKFNNFLKFFENLARKFFEYNLRIFTFLFRNFKNSQTLICLKKQTQKIFSTIIDFIKGTIKAYTKNVINLKNITVDMFTFQFKIIYQNTQLFFQAIKLNFEILKNFFYKMDYQFYFSENISLNPIRILRNVIEDLKVEEPQCDYEMLKLQNEFQIILLQFLLQFMSNQQDSSNCDNDTDSFFFTSVENAFQKLKKEDKSYLTMKDLKQAADSLDLKFSRDVLKSLFREADVNKDKKVTLSEFRNYVYKKDKEMTKMFRVFDKDKSGYISFSELSESFKQTNIKMTKEEIKIIFNEMDEDSDNKISYRDFVQYHHICPAENIRRVFNEYKSSKIDIGENQKINLDQNELSTEKHILLFLPGSLAASVSRTLTAPFEKIKFQMQASLEKQSIKNIIKDKYIQEGLKGFFRGNLVNILRIYPQQQIQCTTYAYMIDRKRLQNKRHKLKKSYKFLIGGLSGALSSIFVYPMSIARTRLILHTQKYKSVFDIWKSIYNKSGIKGIYRGLGTEIVGIFPYIGTQLLIYNQIKEQYLSKTVEIPSAKILLISSATSQLVAQVITYPLYLLQTKLQSGKFNDRINVFHIIKTINRKNGFKGFYQGIALNYFKSVPAVASSFAIHELTYAKLKKYINKQFFILKYNLVIQIIQYFQQLLQYPKIIN